MQCTNSPARWDMNVLGIDIFLLLFLTKHTGGYEKLEQFEVDSKSQTAIDVCIKTPYIVIFTGSLNK